MVCCATALLDFYVLLGLPKWDPDAAAEACRKCCVHYHALSLEAAGGEDSLFWRQKPKMHLFQELAEYQSSVLGR